MPDARPFTVSWEVVSPDQPIVVEREPDQFKTFDPSVFSSLLSGTTAPNSVAPGANAGKQAFDFFGYSFSVGANQYALIFLIAALFPSWSISREGNAFRSR